MSSLSQEELDDIYTFAIELGKNAGNILLKGAQIRIDGGAGDAQVEKDSSVDIVTKTDEGISSITFSALFPRYPPKQFYTSSDNLSNE